MYLPRYLIAVTVVQNSKERIIPKKLGKWFSRTKCRSYVSIGTPGVYICINAESSHGVYRVLVQAEMISCDKRRYGPPLH